MKPQFLDNFHLREFERSHLLPAFVMPSSSSLLGGAGVMRTSGGEQHVAEVEAGAVGSLEPAADPRPD